MSRVSSLSIASLIFLFLCSGVAFAGQWAQQCSAAGKEAQSKCKAAEAALKGKEAGLTSPPGANDIRNNSARLASNAGTLAGLTAATRAECAAAQKECEQKCKAEKGKAQPHASNPQDPLYGPAKQDVSSAIDQATKSDCTGPLSQEQQKLQQAENNLKNDQNAANNSKDASQGGAPQIPPISPPQGGGDKQEEQKQGLNCDNEEGARYSDCNSKFIAKCTDRMSESGCEAFGGRYCGSATGGSSVTMNRTTNLVIDKSGEGLGSGFCKMYTAYKFCQSVGHTDCPSCRGSAAYSSPACQADPSKCVPNMSSGQLSEAQNKCPTDPVFLDPTIAKAIENGTGTSGADGTKNNEPTKTQLPTAGGAGSTGSTAGGSGGGLGSAGNNPAANNETPLGGATPESLPGGNASAVGSGGAGGYGGGEESTSVGEDEKRDPASGGGGNSILPANAVEGMPARDVSNRFGPNLFSISSEIYRTRCAEERFTTCVRKK